MSVFTRRLAVALVGTSALGVAGMAAPAHAQGYGAPAQSQTYEKRPDKKEQEPAKKDYSKAFVEAYGPLSKQFNESVDPATLKAGLPAVFAAVSTPDDKFAAGQIAYNTGVRAEDNELLRRGMEMMLESGRIDAAKLGQYNFIAGQLAFNAKDYATARARFEQAIAAGYSDNDPQALLAESYFSEGNPAAGVEVLDKAIAAKLAAGEAVPDDWLKRGLAVAYEANLAPQATKFARMYVEYYPSKDSWGDAIAIQRNLYNYEGPELLDLMRLAQRTGSLRDERDYVDYIGAADARRLPGEVARIIDAGIAAGLLDAGDPFVVEARGIATGRIKADQADLPDLERDARAANATLVTVSSAGDAFLSYNQPAKAEEFYTMALGMPGIDTARVLTRLGIAQADQGKTAEAMATFAKVDGSRKPIAELWALYVKQKAK